MELSSTSSEPTVSIKSIEFPDEFAHYKTKCFLRNVSHDVINPIRSSDLGVPEIMSTKNPTYLSSSFNSISATTSCSKPLSKISSHVSASRILVDTKYTKSFIKAKQLQFSKPCVDSVVLGAPTSFIGNCRPGREKNQFKLTQDPQKQLCLKNPKRINFKTISQQHELAKVQELVNTAGNVSTVSESQSSVSGICEVIDLSNPMGLDFQGTDYKNTYERDEQSCQNQIEYRKVRRFQHRKNLKAKIAHTVEKEHQDESVNSSPSQVKSHLSLPTILNEKKNFYGILVRAEQKPEIKQKLDKEEEARRNRYKQLYLKKKYKTVKKKEEEILTEEATASNFARMLADKDIKDLVELLDRNVTTKKMELRQLPERRKFPHNISEMRKFRFEMKKSKRVLRDRAKAKQEFYVEIGKPKQIPAAQIEVSSNLLMPSSQSEEQSSNDEDDMFVGKKGSKFLLRGFRYKLDSDLRGKLHQKQTTTGKIKACMTRAEWFESLVSRKINRNKQTDDEMKLFPRELGLKRLFPKSAIKEFRRKPLGQRYERTTRKKLHIKKPKSVKVKKFNLIGYLYGAASRKRTLESKSNSKAINLNKGTIEYMDNKIEREKLKQRMQKRRRMRYLGIPYSEEHRQTEKSKCVDSDSDLSDWIPDDKTEQELTDRIDLRMRGNMPAPVNRETTLRRHPRNSRNYTQLRVPSALFDDFVQKEHIPIMRKLKDDKHFEENVRTVKNTEFAKKFNIRHHHDHWNPTQHKNVNVRYSRKIVKPQPIDVKADHIRSKTPRTFYKTQPREEQDFAMPRFHVDKLTDEHGTKSKTYSKRHKEKQVLQQSKDLVIKSLADGELQEFPGRDKFLEFIEEIKDALNKREGKKDTKLAIDKTAYINELREDLLSIESCLTSLSSSDCTNLSNDSGSFLMMGDKKIPLDYLRKSVVPFEEINRRRIEAVPIEVGNDDSNPYRTGRQKEQLSMARKQDNFFTSNTRLRNDMRQRLEVKSKNPNERLLGTRKGPKAIAQVAIDIDELYIEDLLNPAPLKLFKWNSSRTLIKDAHRKKFESMLIQGEIVRTKIFNRRNEEYFQQMMKSKELFERLFAKWEKKEYEAAMEVVNKVKPYYEATDVYRKERQELNRHYSALNMDIVYLENDWTRLTILQNFHYLLGEMEWRAEHDWIHRMDDGNLEGFEESIAKRNTVNIRQRDKDDAWAIKEYYEEIYLKNLHPIIVVFANANEFIKGIENLKSKTFILLLELHYTLWILTELEQRYQDFCNWCTVELESKKNFAENKCANKYFMEERSEKLKHQMKEFLGDPIDAAFGNKRLSEMKGICNEVYKDILPIADQMDLCALDQVAAISEVLMDLMGKLENIPVAQRIRVEKKHRRLLDYRRNMSKQAVFVERRIASELVKVKRNLAPPFEKPKREGKLPRSKLNKVTRVVHKTPVTISEQAKFFYKAFHDEGDPKGLREARESLDVIDGIQESIVPFYFDHFLIINGYQPNYNFKTQVELRDGPEIDRMQVKQVLPEVMEKFQKWQLMKKRIMEENISKNPQMYENVRI